MERTSRRGHARSWGGPGDHTVERRVLVDGLAMKLDDVIAIRSA